ncbi:hypothetical protein Vadar_022019 [Vaccinium darrowii]|uniref:Uncharacterized protein n=1 Tax=Vaccinium darrowii TaxID=229202 RepID=A0ACB7YXQ3_9ERIC|nr:hypothetical protein Vadar_022019 [Vaccinium darrowii]
MGKGCGLLWEVNEVVQCAHGGGQRWWRRGLAVYILIAGILWTCINYDCDRQRKEFRTTHGNCLVWGTAPSKIQAAHTTTTGETKTSILLTSGCFFLTSTRCFLPFFSLTERKETMIDVPQSMENIGNYTARRSPTELHPEYTERDVARG